MIITRKRAHQLIGPYVQGCDPENLDRIIYLAETDAWNSGKWYGLLRKVFIRAWEGRIVLPREYNVLEAINWDGIPTQIESEWFQFSPNGPGSDWECNPSNIIYDLLDVPTHRMVYEGEQVGVRSTMREDEEAYVVVQGVNSDGNIIYRKYNESNCNQRVDKSDLGEMLKLTDSSFHKTYNKFARDGITNIFKPETLGEVEVFAFGPRYSRHLVTMGPSDTYSSLRAYRIPDDCCKPCYEALVKKREPVPLTQDHEVLQIEDPNALIALCMASFQLYDKMDPNTAAVYFAKGLSALNGRQVEKNGGVQRRIKIWQPSYMRDKRRSPLAF